MRSVSKVYIIKEYRKIMFRLTALVKLAKPGPPLAPILGQQQIKVVDFLSEFNRVTPHLVEGLPVGCRVKKLPGMGKFTLKVCPPSYTTLFFSVADTDRRLTPVDLFKTVYLREGLFPTPVHLKTAMGTLRSCRLRLK